MATLADIIVTLTLDTTEFTRNLQEAEREINNFSQAIAQSTQNMSNEVSQNMAQTSQHIQNVSDVTQQTSQVINQHTNNMSQSLNNVGQSSRHLARTLDTSLRSQRRILVAGTREFRAFAQAGRQVSQEIRDEFSGLPRHLQLYVQRLREAGESTESFARLNEMYSRRVIEAMRRSNDYMQQRTTQSARLMRSFAENTNLAPLTNGFLRLANNMEQSSRQGTALNVALQRLGDNPSLKQVNDEIKFITQGLARARGALIGFGIAGGLAIWGMIVLANTVDERVAPAFEALKSTWVDAMMPFIEAFASGMIHVMNFAKAIGELVDKFSEAHPVIFSMIMSILMLTLVLGALLSPLAVTGVMAEGVAVAFTALWATIGPFVTGMLAVVGVALAVATALVVVYVSIKRLWQYSEEFRNAFINLWNGVKEAVVNGFVKPVSEAWEELKKSFGGLIKTITGEGTKMANLWEWLGDKIAVVVNFLAKGILPILELAFSTLGFVVSGAIKVIAMAIDLLSPAIEKLRDVAEGIKKSFSAGNFADIGDSVAGVIELILATLIGGIPKLIAMGTQLIEKLAEGMGMTVPELIELPFKIITDLVTGFIKQLPRIIEIAGQIIQGFLNGLLQALPVLLEGLTGLITMIVGMFSTLITEYLPVLLEAGMTMLQAIIDGIITNLPLIIETILTLITTFIDVIVENLPMIIDAGLQLLQAVITGIMDNLPILVEAIIQLVTSILQAIIDNLPTILQAGIQILLALIDGIVQVLPQLIQTAIMLIKMVAKMLIDNLPMIIKAGIEILLALIDGIIEILPQLIETAMMLIEEICLAIIDNLPEIIEAGIEIILALIDGLIEAIPDLVAAIPQIVTAIFDAFADVEWGQIGSEIMSGIGAGITKAKDAVFGTVSSIASGLLKQAKKVLDINSPSKEFAKQVGQWIPAGIAVGIEGEAKTPIKAVGEVSEDVLSNSGFKGRALQFPNLEHGKASGNQQVPYTSNDQYIIHATIREDADIQRIIDELEKRKRVSERARGVFSY